MAVWDVCAGGGGKITDDVIHDVSDVLEPGDLVLVKASKSVELWTVAEAILAATPNTDSENTDGENGGDSQ